MPQWFPTFGFRFWVRISFVSFLKNVITSGKTYFSWRKMNTHFSVLAGRGVQSSLAVELNGFQCKGVLEASLRDGFRMWGRQMSVALVAVEGGYVIRAVLGSQKSGVFLMAEHSQQMRVFKKADSALSVCRKLGLPVVSVEL